MSKCKVGFFLGTGADTNVEVGFIPDVVFVTNITDGDTINSAFPSIKKMAFTSGGTNQIRAGHTIVGATSGARALVRDVVLASGTWAAGTAAGTLTLVADSISGTFTSESIYYVGSSGTDDATGAASAAIGTLTDTAVAAATTVTPYTGSAGTAAKGFTVLAAASESGKVFAYTALAE